MIEGTRVAVTDGQGLFLITGLVPGVYSVTFTLPGFSTFVREEITLTVGFTATANADMAVGGVEETVTVTGATAGVDIHNVREQNVLSRETVDTLPTNKSTSGFAALTLGAIGAAQDVGGNTGEAPTSFGVHGTSGGQGRHLLDGMPMTGLLFGGGMGTRLNFVNQLAIEEVALTTRGASAETETGGPQLNYIPKSGGNVFTYSASLTGANSSMQSDKLTDELRARGLTTVPSLKELIDVGAGVGGPIVRDRAWFYGSFRWWDTETFRPGMFFNDETAPAARGGLLWVPDLSRPAFTRSPNKDGTIRITWQAMENHRFMASQNVQDNCFCFQGVGLSQAPSATIDINGSSSLTQFTWSNARTNRLLLEGGVTGLYQTQQPNRPEGVSTTDIAVVETTLGLSYNARAKSAGNQFFFGGAGLGGDTLAYVTDVNFSQINGRFSMSYVTGSHAFKTGFFLQKGWQGGFYKFNDPPIEYTLTNGAATSVVQWADPVSYRSNLDRNIGLYAQDQWTVDRLTLNLGVRLDTIAASNPPHSTPGGLFIGDRTFTEVKNVPNWKDISPRIGAAFDVGGDGRTAVKAQIGRYVDTETTSIAVLNHPAYAITTKVSRTWNDVNGDLVVDCDLQDNAANSVGGDICGATNGVLGSLANVRSWKKEAKEGWFTRGYNWQASVTFEHELTRELTVTAGYYRTWVGNFRTNDNLLRSPTDYDAYSVTTPTNANLPGGGGQVITGLFDLDPVARTRVDNLVVQTSDFGKRTQVYNGFDVALNARFGDGGFAQGGVSSGQTVSDNCVVVDNPQQRFCKTTVPFAGQTQVKFNASYPLPYDVLISGVFQNLPGPTYGANGIFFAGTGLGRAFSGGIAFVPMIEPNTLREPRFTQIDMRFSKVLPVGGGRIRVDFDLFNITNSRAILSESSTYGLITSPTSAPSSGWRFPSNVLGGRMWRFGALIDF